MSEELWKHTDGLWHHYTTVYNDDGSISYYIDGVLYGVKVKIFDRK
jgi:hypothetical protein